MDMYQPNSYESTITFGSPSSSYMMSCNPASVQSTVSSQYSVDQQPQQQQQQLHTTNHSFDHSNQQKLQHHHHHYQRRSKKCKIDYTNCTCAVCNAPADGLHYGAISCRSCNAFFRRAITYKQHFTCRMEGNCDVDVNVRCACRACRLAKCTLAGMRETDVQPKRDPTGSQKNRRAPQRRGQLTFLLEDSPSKMVVVKSEPDSGTEHSPNTLLPSIEGCIEKMGDSRTDEDRKCAYLDEKNPFPQTTSIHPTMMDDASADAAEDAAIQFIKSIKGEEALASTEGEERRADGDDDDGEGQMESTSRMPAGATIGFGGRNGQLEDDGAAQREFEDLVRDYREHLRWMNRAMTPIETFLSEEHGSCSKWRIMQPADVDLLSKVELSGLMYWIEKLTPFRRLPVKERGALFKRYSVRKLSLDHFYTASKYPELIAKGHFAMLNNTYVPPNRTGFETKSDDDHTREAKFQILRPTIDRLWSTLVLPFANLHITDAEIVALHLLLMWSANHNRFVDLASTRQMMRERRDWAVQRLHRHYLASGVEDPAVRLGEILLLLPELEVICDIHCKDFQVAQLFEFCNMSEYWYEHYAYTSLNIS